MKSCFIVAHRNYADGLMAYAFFDEKDARMDVEEDVAETVDALLRQGYEPTTIRDGEDDVEVYVADSDIYYEWSVISSSIR